MNDVVVILAAIALVYWAYFGEPARAQTRTANSNWPSTSTRSLSRINTVTATGDTARAARPWPTTFALPAQKSNVQVFTPAPRKGNLVARYAGRGRAGRCCLLGISTWLGETRGLVG